MRKEVKSITIQIFMESYRFIQTVENDIRLYGKDLKCYVVISSRSVANSPDIQIVSRFSLKKSIIGGMTDKEYALSITLEELLNRLRYEHYVPEEI